MGDSKYGQKIRHNKRSPARLPARLRPPLHRRADGIRGADPVPSTAWRRSADGGGGEAEGGGRPGRRAAMTAIKSVVLHGYRSFGERSVVPLGAGLNCVVGRIAAGSRRSSKPSAGVSGAHHGAPDEIVFCGTDAVPAARRALVSVRLAFGGAAAPATEWTRSRDLKGGDGFEATGPADRQNPRVDCLGADTRAAISGLVAARHTGAVILIDEAEAGLPEGEIEALHAEIRVLASGNQVIAATHDKRLMKAALSVVGVTRGASGSSVAFQMKPPPSLR
ncbi:MAG: hypothetical protein R3F11_17655 [Verrucomicrobiales bacterium]